MAEACAAGSRTIPPLPTRSPADLELWLDEHDEVPGGRQRLRRTAAPSTVSEMKGHIGDHQVEGVPPGPPTSAWRKLVRSTTVTRESGAERPRQLPVPDVRRDHVGGAGLEQASR